MPHFLRQFTRYIAGITVLIWATGGSASGTERQAAFKLQVDMFKTDQLSGTLEPKANTVRDLTTELERGKDIKITARAKQLIGTYDYLQVEVYVENLQAQPLDDVVLHLDRASDSAPLYDMTVDAYNQVALEAPYDLKVGRLAANGIKRLIIGMKKEFKPEFKGRLTYALGSGEGQTTTNILVIPAGNELWAVSTDTNEVVAFSLPSKTEIARIAVGARPVGVTMQQLRDWIVVTSAGSNTLTVIDRKSKKVLSTLGAGDIYGRDLRNVLTSQASSTIYVSSYVEGILTKIELDAAAQPIGSQVIQLGPRPTGMSMTFDESYLYVAHFLPRGTIQHNEAWVSIVNLKTFAKEREAIIEDHFNPTNPRMKCLADFYNSYPPAQLIYGKLEPKDFSLEGVASQLTGVFLDPSGQKAWIPGTRITGALVVLERGPNADKSLTRFGGLQPAQLSAPLIFPLDASDKSNLKDMFVRDIEMALPTLQNVVTCQRQPLEIEFIDRALQNDGKEQSNPFLAYGVPHAGLTGLGLVNTIKFTKGGRKALMLSHTSAELAVYDAVTVNPASQLHLPLSGENPKGMALTPDFQRAYVLYENSLFISELDTSAYSPKSAAALPEPYEIPYSYAVTSSNVVQLGSVVGLPLVRNIENVDLQPTVRELGQITLVGEDPLPAAMRRGKVLFQSANPDRYSVSANRLGACASCHPDGGNDGSSWVTMEGPRRTLGLRGGVADRGWLHISATHTDAKEFVDTIVPERLGGQLSEPDLKAMALYLDSGIPKLQNPRVDAAKAKKGQQLFAANCVGCHRGTAYTSGNKADGSARVYNIGSGSLDHSVSSGKFSNTLIGLADPLSQEIAETLAGDRPLGPGDRLQEILDYRQRPARKFGEFKAASLVNAFDNVVFMHDGSIDSLRGAIVRINELLSFGLKSDEIDALEEYIKTL